MVIRVCLVQRLSLTSWVSSMQRKKIDLVLNDFPKELHPFLENKTLYDSSCSELAKTYLLKGEESLYLKVEKMGRLLREAELTKFFHKHRLASEVVFYKTIDEHDYLITREIKGEDGINKIHLDNPKQLAKVYGESLRLIHELPTDNCPFPNRMSEMIHEAELNLEMKKIDKIFLPEPIATITDRFNQLKHLSTDEVVLHGDYCLPNIILNDFKLKGFVDLGSGGVGDRHWDLFWGVWTLQFNLKTDKYKNIFLDAYGLEHIDNDKMDLCRLISGLIE